MNCPLLIEGTHWVATDKWPLQLTRDVDYELNYDLGATYDFFSGTQLLARHHKGVMTVRAGYACDGYSPVIRKPRWMPGASRYIRLTPTPRCGMAPAVLHDVLRAFVPVHQCPWTRENTDDWFFDALVAGGCSDVAGAYHQAVAGQVGTVWIHLTRKPDPKLTIARTRYFL